MEDPSLSVMGRLAAPPEWEPDTPPSLLAQSWALEHPTETALVLTTTRRDFGDRRGTVWFRDHFIAHRGDAAAVRSNERTLKTYLSRVEKDMPEAVSYRASLAGEQQ